MADKYLGDYAQDVKNLLAPSSMKGEFQNDTALAFFVKSLEVCETALESPGTNRKAFIRALSRVLQIQASDLTSAQTLLSLSQSSQSA